MSLCKGSKYATYILELVRNNGIKNAGKEDGDSEENKRKTEDKNEKLSGFLMFDYFDVLYCKELCDEDKKYLNYLSIENVFEDAIKNSRDYRVSYKTLSLYCKSDNNGFKSYQKNIFSIKDSGEELSDTPFLGLIQISLCKDNYIGGDLKRIDIDGFLEECEQRILEIASKYITSKTQTQLFRSSTTGDFCFALRTDSVEAIYSVAIALNGTQNSKEEPVKMLTFTNVGIECRYRGNTGYATLSKKYVADHPKIVVALRFSGDESLREALESFIKSNKKKGKIETIKGLFGRYEYLLHIGLAEFSDIYPFLCEKKFGVHGTEVEKSEIEKPELEKIFRESSIRNINERILVELAGENLLKLDQLKILDHKENGMTKKDDKKVGDEVFAKNETLFDRIRGLEKWKKYFYEDHFAFQDLIRGMKEICKAFSPTGMDEESYISWQIFHKDMIILCDCIEWMLEDYKKWEKGKDIRRSDKKKYRRTVLEGWRANLKAINRYTTLVQNVNYQTYQAPIYEIQTQIDTEKAMVAYREAVELYIDGAIQERIDKWNDKNIGRVYPVIYPDLSKGKVEVTAPFMVKSSDRGVIPRREIICTVPSFEYFGRLYDLLPWVLHETSHHLNVLKREDRNDFVIDYILFYVLKFAMRGSMQKLANCDFYENTGKAEQYLITSMTKAAKEEICNQTGYEEFNFEKLMLEIENWLKKRFPSGVGYNNKVYREEEEQLKKKVFRFWLDAYRKEGILRDENLTMILKIWEEDARKEKEELTKRLLVKYFDGLGEELKGQLKECEICLKDMYESGLMEKKLTDIAGFLEKENKIPVSEKNKVAIKDYCCKIIDLSRTVNIDMEDAEKKGDSESTKEYLRKVFEYYQETYSSEKEKNNMIIDVASMHIMRDLGLLSDKLEVFQTVMDDIMRNVNNAELMRQKSIKQKIYLETFADLLMATSLQLNSFGYCRQVLQTLSDAKIEDQEEEYESINYERWRTVAAVLLAEETGDSLKADNGLYKIKAEDLIEKSKTYCLYTLRCIKEKLLKKEEFKNNDENREKLVKLLKKIYFQIDRSLGKYDLSLREESLLNILLQGNEKLESYVVEEWREYKEYIGIIGLCEPVKYNFWRILCFCRGISNIVNNGYITVSEKLFEHMKKIRAEVNSKNERGCTWEKNYKYLVKPKRDVGEFYNIPEQVHEKTPDQKLENTIDFIQNYYYYNRFRIMNKDTL